MKKLLGLALALAVLPAFATKVETPVTKAEAAAVFAKAEQVMRSVVHYTAATPVFAPGSGVATREQILRHLESLRAAIQPKFKYTLPRQPTNPSVITFKDPALKQLAEKLETLGFVDRYGPLVTSNAEGVLPEDFGDAIGYFMARIADMTHTPSTKFTPFLMPP
jgi:hypothetical protein